MNDEEIMRKFNETFSDSSIEQENKESIPVTPYRVTSNQNTIPTNLSNQNTNNYIPPLVNNEQVNNNPINNNEMNSESINNQNVQRMMQVDNTNYTTYESQQSYGSNVNYNYVPSYGTTKKKKTISFKISPELMPILLIVLVLFIIILIIPFVYDLFTGL